jgi:outer membrane protein OmpA-like peptidoglycan-associated protein
MKLVSILTLLTLFYTLSGFAQKSKTNYSIADCDGAIAIFKSGNYSYKFTGNLGAKDEFVKVAHLKDSLDKNMVWVSFLANQKGKINFSASVDREYLQFIYFIGKTETICKDITSGLLKEKGKFLPKNTKSVGVAEVTKNGFLPEISLKTGQRIMIGFCTATQSTGTIDLNFTFTPSSDIPLEMEEVDNRDDLGIPYLRISIRDLETDAPIRATTVLDGDKQLDAIYVASEIYINPYGSTSLTLKCDAKNYFFKDTVVEILSKVDQIIVVKLDPISKGKSMQIEQIEFEAGTAKILEESQDDIERLKEFLLYNEQLIVEIQGHVFADGENTGSCQRMSEERAKTVMKYLISNGVDKNRLSAVGYGNTKPVYPNATREYQQQANRRVEILVK